tara:strand:+ start:698 stop:877 length:180 start_codon:yes stop_codon:yes gene_type:complete
MKNNNYEYTILEEGEVADHHDKLDKECIWINLYDSDKLVNKNKMTKRFQEINCNMNNIL